MSSISVTLMIMQSDQKQVPSMTLTIPENYSIKNMQDFLERQKKIPFKHYFITNKPAERWQFSEDKTIKEIRNQCQTYQGNMLLLVYKTSIQPVHQMASIPNPVKKTPSESNSDNCCLLF